MPPPGSNRFCWVDAPSSRPCGPDSIGPDSTGRRTAMTHMSAEEAEAYRRPVLDALGPDDPFEVQAGELDLWRRLLEAAGASLRIRPAEGEWSVIECLGHMADSELVTSVRYRWVLAEDEPPLQGYDQEAWTARFDHAHDDPVLLLDLLFALRNANLALWNRASPADRARTGIHACLLYTSPSPRD